MFLKNPQAKKFIKWERAQEIHPMLNFMPVSVLSMTGIFVLQNESFSFSRHNSYIQECTGHLEPTYHASIHDLRLLLQRFAFEKSFSEDTGGGGRDSNIKFVPYAMHMILYVLNTWEPLTCQFSCKACTNVVHESGGRLRYSGLMISSLFYSLRDLDLDTPLSFHRTPLPSKVYMGTKFCGWTGGRGLGSPWLTTTPSNSAHWVTSYMFI